MTYASTILTDTPVGYWRQTETSGANSDDATASGNDGTWTGTYTRGVTGLLSGDLDKATQLAGAGYLAVPDLAAYSIANTGSLSLECLFQRTTTGTDESLFHKGTGTFEYRVRLRGDTVQVTVWDAGGGSVASFQTASFPNQTGVHHLIVALATNAIDVFVDGTLLGSSSTAWVGTPGNGTDTLVIGRREDTADQYFSGILDEVAIYGSRLTLVKAAAHYTAVAGGGGGASSSANAGTATAAVTATVASSAALAVDAGRALATATAQPPVFGAVFKTVTPATATASSTALGGNSAPTRSALAGVASASVTSPVAPHSAVPGRASATVVAGAPTIGQAGATSLQFDIYAAANPNGPRLATLTDALNRKVSIQRDGPGSGEFTIPRSSVYATGAIIAQGNLVKVRLAEVSPLPICAFWMETGRFDLVGTGDAPEYLTFGGPGALAYLSRAIMWTTSFVAGEASPVANEWALADGINGSRAGAILRRIIDEAISPSRPQQPLPSLSVHFDYATDSSSANWSNTPGTAGFTAHVGDHLDDVVDALRGATTSFTVQMDANLGLYAYNALGVNRASLAFAAGKVRLVKGVNLATALTRELAAARIVSHMLVAGDTGFFGTAESTTTPIREGFASTNGDDPAALDAVASSQLALRSANADSVRVGIPYGNTPTTTGLYMPGPVGTNGHYWVGDTITVHTGTTSLDYNESTQSIAEITISEDDAGQPLVDVALGSTFSASGFSAISDVINENRSDIATSTNEAVQYAHSLQGLVKVVPALPTLPDASYPVGQVVMLTTENGKLYRNWDNIAWTAEINAPDISGQITSVQIGEDAIGAPQILAGSIGASEIAAGSIGTDALAANSILAGNIAAGAIGTQALAAEIILADKLLATGTSGRRVEIDDAGLRAYSGSEQVLVNVPTTGTDPNVFVGEIEAASLVSTAHAELRGANTLSAGSVTTLQFGIVDPTSAPVVTTVQPSLLLPDVGSLSLGHGVGYDPAGGALGVDPSFWVGADPTVGNLLDLAYERSAATGALLRTLRKTGTTTTTTTTLGSTSHVTDTAQAASGAGSSQVATPVTMPRAGTVTKIAGYLAGYLGDVTVKLAIWNTSGTLLRSSAAFTATSRTFDNGASDKYERSITPLDLAAGQTVWVGFLHTSSGDGFQWDRDDGSGKTTKIGDGLDGTMTSIATLSGHKPDAWLTYTYGVDASAEGSVAKIVGVARAGTDVWVLDAAGILYRYTQATLAYTGRFDLSSRITGADPAAGLFFDGSFLVITTATSLAVGVQVRFVRVSTGGVYQNTLDGSGLPVNGATTTIRGGYSDGTNYWVSINGTVYAFSKVTGANVVNRDFGLSVESASGVTWDGSAFRGWSAVANPSRIFRYTTWDWTTESAVYWVAYSWFDQTGTPHESYVSPRTGITLRRRQAISIGTPAIPGAASEPPDRVRVYLARGAADPGGTGYALQATDALTVRSLETFNTGGAANPATNNFPIGTPAEVKSAQASYSLKGDGTVLGLIRAGAAEGLRVQEGTQNLTWSAANLSDTPTVTFPVAFSGTPVWVVLTLYGAAGAVNYAVALTGTPSASSFTLRGVRIDGSSPSATIACAWVAIGPA